jgi:HEAT repeat protein
MNCTRSKALADFDHRSRTNVLRYAIASLAITLCSCHAGATKDGIPTDVTHDIRVLIQKTLYGSSKDQSEALSKLQQSRDRAIPVVPYLIDKLGDADAKVANGARLAIESIGDASVEPLIAAIGVKKHKEQELLIISLLGRIGDPRAVPILIALLDDANVDVRERAAIALGEVPDQRSFEPLMRRLQDSDYQVVRSAVWALGKIGDRRAVDPIIALLVKKSKDRQNDVRKYAANSLGELGDRRAFDSLLAVYQDKEYPDRDQPDWVLRNDALTALGQTRDPRAFDVLRRALKEGDVFERVAAVEGLGGLRDARSIAVLEGILKDERPTNPSQKKAHRVASDPRATAARALVATGDDGAIDAVFSEYQVSPEVKEDSEDSRRDIRFRIAAVDAFAMSPKPHAYLKVIDILKGNDTRMRNEATRVLKAGTISSVFLMDTVPDSR